MTQNSQKSQQYFLCEKCDYECCRKNDFNKHLLTAKHKNNDVSLQNNLKTLKKFICSCGKEYNYRQGLYFHKKTCKMNNIESDKTEEQEKIRKLIHDIRNMLKLTDEDIAYIETLNDKQKMEVIIEYDKVLHVFVQSVYSLL